MGSCAPRTNACSRGDQRRGPWSLAWAVGLACLASCVGVDRGAEVPETCELSLVTWNLLHGANEQGALNLEAKGRYLRGLQADLTFLQEIDRGCRRTGAVDQMQVLGAITQQRPAFASFMDYQGGEYGLGMLTGLPAFEPLALRLPDGDEPRAALLWEVEVEGERLLCVNVHFNWVEDDGARFAQATALLAVLATRGGACIVAGDFNDRPGSRTLAAFQAAGFRHADPHGPTWNAREPSKDIDHVLIRSGAGLALESLGGAILDGDLLSDHRLVRALLRVQQLR